MSKTKTKQPQKDLVAEIIIQPYQFRLTVVISDDIPRAVRRFPLLAKAEVESSEGMFISLDWDFFIFLRHPLVTHLHLAHEIFHCAMRMADTADVKFDIENHEAHAYLVGYITDRVYHLIQRQWKIHIR